MTRRIKIRSKARLSSDGKHIRVRTSVNNGRSVRSRTKTIRVK